MRLVSWASTLLVAISMGTLMGCDGVSPNTAAVSGSAGAQPARGGSGAEVPDAATLKQWAESLAQSQLEQLAAAEMLYHARTFEHALVTDSGFLTMYGKFYRQFTDFEVVDIERTPSLLQPVKYTIRYNFDAVGTLPIDATRQEAAKIERARSDYFFVKQQEDSVVRTYESDADGRPIDTYSPYLDRPNYWEYRTTEDLFGHRWTLIDVTRSQGSS